MASILPHTHQPRLKNSFYLIDESTGFSGEKDKRKHIRLPKGNFEQQDEIFFHARFIGNAKNTFSRANFLL